MGLKLHRHSSWPFPTLAVLLWCVAGASLHSADDAARLSQLNAYWQEVARAVLTGDFEAYRATCHGEGVLVSGAKRTSYPLTTALAGWKQGFVDTQAGRMKASVEFRFSQRWGDETTAHETGIFLYTKTGPDGERQERFIHFEALLVKKERWTILMEYQKGPATREEWDRLPALPAPLAPTSTKGISQP